MDSASLESLRNLFLDEGAEQVETFFLHLVELEEAPSGPSVATTLGNLHNLKGSAAGVGFTELGAFAHRLEDCLAPFREPGRVPAEVLEALFEAADAMGLHLEESRRLRPPAEARGRGLRAMECWAPPRSAGRPESPDTLESPVPSDPSAPVPAQPPPENASGTPGADLPEPPPELLSRAAQESARVVGLFLVPDTPMPSLRLSLARSALGRRGEVLAEVPGAAGGGEGLWLLWRAPGPEHESGAHSGAEPGTQAGALEEEVRGYCPFPEIARVQVFEPPGPAPAPVAGPEAEEAFLGGRASRIRVPIDQIDRLLLLTGEIGSAQGSLRDFLRQSLEGLPLSRRVRYQLEEQLEDQQARLTRLLREVMTTRMVPLARLFQRFPRLVRDLGRRLGKPVRLVVEGEGTELDTAMVERLGDPLVHLLRNAVDHGIESPEERSRQGKEPTGTLTLRAESLGHEVRVTVSDDGAGIDPVELRERALDRGLLTEAEEFPDQPLAWLDLLAAPGFTSRDRVSEISGRGVGLDVVRRAAEGLNGKLSLESRPRLGTRFELRFPLTLATTDALLVRVRGQVYALPLAEIEEVVRRSEVEPVDPPGPDAACRWRGRTLEHLWLGELLDRPPGEGTEASMLVVARGEPGLGLWVDEQLGEASLVVRPLTLHFHEVEGVAGAAVGHDGRVVLILDLPVLLRQRRERLAQEEGRHVEEGRDRR